MAKVYVSLALPNPAGKDRSAYGGTTNQQLNGEWVEIHARELVGLAGIRLAHNTFTRDCTPIQEDTLFAFGSISLYAGQSVRVHTGRGTAFWDGTILHVFAGRGNYVWNNACGDAAVLRTASGSLVDWAGYDPYPPDGAVLYRQLGTNRLLVGVGVSAGR